MSRVVEQSSHSDGGHVGARDASPAAQLVALLDAPRRVAARAVLQAAGADDGVGHARATQRLLALYRAEESVSAGAQRAGLGGRTSNLASMSRYLTVFSMRRMGDQNWCGDTKAELTSATRCTPAAFAASATTRTPCGAKRRSARACRASQKNRTAPNLVVDGVCA